MTERGFRRQHWVFAKANKAWERLDGSEWLTDFKYGLLERRDELEGGDETNLYAMLDGAGKAVKIGVAGNPVARMRNAQVANPRQLTLVAAFPATYGIERYFHEYLSDWRIRGEWFSLSTEVLAVLSLIASCEDITEDLNAALVEDEAPADSSDTLAHLYSFVEEALLYADAVLGEAAA